MGDEIVAKSTLAAFSDCVAHERSDQDEEQAAVSDCDDAGDNADDDADEIVLNVGGVLFETRRSTLLAVPGSRLAAIAARGRKHESYRPRRGDYYFDRNPGAFDAVLQYHRSGELHAGAGLCGKVLKTEFEYWGIDYLKVEQCCWDEFNSRLSASTDFTKLDKLFSDIDHPDDSTMAAMPAWKYCATVAWLTLEAPSYSKLAKVYLSITTAFTLASVAVFLAESHASLTVSYCCYTSNHSDISTRTLAMNDVFPCDGARVALDGNSSVSVVREDYVPALRYADLTVYTFFLLDFLLRASLSQRKKQFVTSLANVVDFVCIVSQTIAISERYAVNDAHLHEATTVLTSSTQWIRTFRLLRIFKILRHSVMVKVLAYTILTAFRELIVVLLVLLTFVTLFGSVAYYVEPETFPTITYGCWWALVTLTTIGYGDVTPKTTGGYIVGTLCALCGVFSVAFTVPIVVSNFNTYYSHAQSHKARASHEEAAAATASGTDDRRKSRRGEAVKSGVELQSYSAVHKESRHDWDRLQKHSWASSVATNYPQTVIELAGGKVSTDERHLDGAAERRCEFVTSGYNHGFVSGDGDLCPSTIKLSSDGGEEIVGCVARCTE